MRLTIAVIIAFAMLADLTTGYMWNRPQTRIILQSIQNMKSISQPRLNKLSFTSSRQIQLSAVEAYGSSALSPDDGQKVKPQDLLRKYGPAYLITSITLAIISYALCYLLISTGVDVISLLKKVGIESSVAAANTGTAAIAYAVHKAASPIRFPPTVALTPVVARWFGRKEKK